jgi:polar amino acid transport system substrate-binding protein
MGQKVIGIWGSLILATFGFVAAPVGSAGAESVLDKISRTGTLTAGTRNSSIPFGYINEDKEWVGFSVDLIKQIQQRLDRKLGKKIRLELKAVTPQTRIPMVVNRTIDIECGNTTYTRSRDETVDFSINFFYAGSQLLVSKTSFITSLAGAAGRRVGATKGTTNAEIIKEKQPRATLILFQSHEEGFQALQQKKIDAYATDGVLLAGLVSKSPNPDDFEIVDFFSKEPYSCILPEDDSKWQDFVNHTLMELIENGTYFKLYDKWFGPKGVIHYPMPNVIKLYILFQVMPK